MADAQQAGPPLGVVDTSGTAAGIFLVLITLAVFLLPIFILFPPFPPSPSEALAQTHIKLGLPKSKTNLPDSRPGVVKNRANATATATATAKPGISSIWVYPVKSCRGVELAKCRVLPQGLQFDRLFTFAQLKSPFPAPLPTDEGKDEGEGDAWHFITQRQFPLLATVTVEIWVPDEGGNKATATLPSTDRKDLSDVFLILRFPWREAGFAGLLAWAAAKLRGGLGAQPEREVLLPVAAPSSEAEMESAGYGREPVTIWKDTIEAIDMSADLPRELQLYLGVSNKLGLFRVDPARLREVMRCAPRKEAAGYQPVTGFQDAYPLHMINLESVRHFEGLVKLDEDLDKLDARRFRANIIIDGVPAYDEETWKSIGFKSKSTRQETRFDVSCRTVRCKMPNVDPDTGFRHPVEPDKSLRLHREVDAGAPRMGCLGMQMTPLFENLADPSDLESWVEVGMEVEASQLGSHLYIKQ